MGTQTQLEPVQSELTKQKWSAAGRAAFQFCFVYFGLFCLYGQIFTSLFPIPKVDIPDPSVLWPMRQIVFWTAAHIFHVTSALVYEGSGSGDKTFDWVLVFCLLVFASIATVSWSILDKRRENYAGLLKWFRIFIRFALAGQMMTYGIVKVIPMQMPHPSLRALLEPFGDFSPMGVLWRSIGASTAYEVFAGSAELIGGLLLIVPRTTMFGALICLVDMIEVFALNMTYDVPVKLFSFHLILLSLFLLMPDFQRLVKFFFLNQTAEPSAQIPIFETPRANRIAFAAQVLFGLWLLGMNIYGTGPNWYVYGGGQPKSPLYGIWDVEQISIDGQLRSPLVTDYGRWRRVIFDATTRVTFERMDGSFAGFGASFDKGNKSLALTKEGDKNWKGNFASESIAPGQLTLDGDMDKHKILMRLRLVDCNKFLLVSRGFHWIQEYPFNR